MIRALIVDDERLARQKVHRFLASAKDVEVVGECASGAEAVQAIRRERPDLVFLDVQMPGLDGFDVLQEAGPSNVGGVIFVTAHDEHAVRAFEVQALDYLLKPFDAPRFHAALDRARRRGAGELHRKLEQLLVDLGREGGRERGRADRLLVRSTGRIRFVRVDDIDWIEAEDNYARLHVGKESHLVRETMSALEGRLDPARFVRVHRKAIVNLDAIAEVRALARGDYEVLLRIGTTVAVGRSYRDRLFGAAGG
jgi:two-component system LytT family response regulator